MNGISTKKKGFATGITILAFACVVVLGFIFLRPNSNGPSPENILPQLKAFILEDGKNKCSGTFEISMLEDVEVGEYRKELKAWPIYANHETVCKKVSSSGTSSTLRSNNMDSVSKKVSVAFVRKSGDGYVIFIPEIITDAMGDFNKKLQNASDKGLEEFKANLKTQ